MEEKDTLEIECKLDCSNNNDAKNNNDKPEMFFLFEVCQMEESSESKIKQRNY